MKIPTLNVIASKFSRIFNKEAKDNMISTATEKEDISSSSFYPADCSAKFVIKKGHKIWIFTKELPNGYKYIGVYSKKIKNSRKTQLNYRRSNEHVKDK